MAMVARLVPWSIVGLSLMVLGALVVLTPHLDASPASLSGGPESAPQDSPPWILGVLLVGVGSLITLLTMMRPEKDQGG